MIFAPSKKNILPGFGLTMGYTLLYVSLIVLIPLSSVVFKTASLSWGGFLAQVLDPRVLASFRLTFGSAILAALVNSVFGVLTAWVLVRYRIPGKRVVDALVDLPFALPTAVAGITLATLYAPAGWIGRYLEPLGIKIAYTPTGIAIALIFIGLPFVVRTVQPVLEEFDRELEEASATLGANRRQTVFHVILPSLMPAILTGFALALARAVGEYGSVIFIAGNMPFISEIAPLLIIIRLEEFSYPQAAAIGTAMLMISFGILLFVHLVQAWARNRFGQ